MVWYKACALAALQRNEVSLVTFGISAYTTISSLKKPITQSKFFFAGATDINPELIRTHCYFKSADQGLHARRIKHSKELRQIIRKSLAIRV